MKSLKARIIITTIIMSFSILSLFFLGFLFTKYVTGTIGGESFAAFLSEYLMQILLVLLFFTLLIFAYFTYHRILLDRDRIEKEEGSKKRRIDQIITGLADDFVFLSFVDLEANKQEILKADLFGEDISDVSQSLEEALQMSYMDRTVLYANRHVHPDDREHYIHSCEKERVMSELRKSKAYHVNYRLIRDGMTYYFQLKFAEVDPNRPSYVLLGAHSIDEVRRTEIQRSEELTRVRKNAEEMAKSEAIYRDAIFAKANSYYQINITQNRIVTPIWEIVNGQPQDYSYKFGALYPNYDDVVQMAAECFVAEGYKDLYRKYVSREYLLNCFDEGKTLPEYICRIYSSHLGIHFRKYSHYLTKDEQTGDVMAMCVANDVTNEYKQDEILRNCINKIQKKKDTELIIQEILTIIGEYYDADRAGIFVIDRVRSYTKKIYEWCAPGVCPMLPGNNTFDLAPQQNLMNLLEESGFFHDEIENMQSSVSEEQWKLFMNGGIHSATSVPMWSGDEMVGFVALDNAKNNLEDVFLLTAIATLSYAEILRRQEGLQDTAIVKALSQDYETIYYVNLDTFQYKIHSRRPDDDWLNRNIIFGGNDFFKEIAEYIPKVTYESDRLMMLDYLTFDNLMRRFETESVLKVDYRLAEDGEPVYHTMKIVHTKTRTGNGSMVIGVSNIDEDTKSRYALLDELAEAKDQAENASRAKSDFLSKMSHDIRTPINGVMGMTEIARQSIENPEQVMSCLNKIDGASQHLLELINEVLDMTQIEHGKIPISHNPFSLHGFCENCYAIIEGQLVGHDIEFNMDLSEIIHDRLVGDELHIRQILINILGNAVKFTPEGGKISFKVKELYSNSKRAGYSMEVTDTGCGMSPEYVKTIFEPFSQEGADARSTYSGTGLGMSITHKLATLLGGDIQVTSEKGVGSKFTVNLPIDLNTEEDASVEETVVSDLSGLHVLVVEDNELNAEIAKTLLENRGVVCEVAENGEVALEMFEHSSVGEYDIILMDIMMPIMDGIEATECIRKLQRADASTVPIIAMTANAYEEDRKRSAAAGMNAHISKPVSPKLLTEILAGYVHT